MPQSHVHSTRAWTRLPDHKLLDVRLCDLDLDLERSPVMPRIEQLYRELDRRHLVFRPHCWLSDEWYTPDGVPGIAIPFYLAHPRLAELEHSQMREVEGGTAEWCMRILRHETGHAIENAYRLRRRRLRQDVAAVSSGLRAEAVQQAVRAPPRGLLRAEPPRRGLRRDLRRVADAEVELAAALCRLARASQAGVRRRSHGRDRRSAAAGAGASGRRSAPRAPQDAARVLSREALALRARQLAGVRRGAPPRLLDPEGLRQPPEGGGVPAQRTLPAPPQGLRPHRRAPVHRRPGARRHDRARIRPRPAAHALARTDDARLRHRADEPDHALPAQRPASGGVVKKLRL